MNRSIVHIHAREILDSRGNPTLETQVRLEDGTAATPSEPSSSLTCVSSVGLPRESRISRA